MRDDIAAWFIDTDYNEESFFVRHAYFLGANDPYKALKTALRAEIDEEAWSTLYRATSRPFPRPRDGRNRGQGYQPLRRRGDEGLPGVSLMRFLLADSFTSTLARLPAQEAKAVKTTVVDLQIDPAGKGLSFHRIGRSKDPNFWSVRVARDLRLIVHRTEDSLLVAYVDHHDKAYAWAERRRIETHPSTGAIQIVEVRERVEEVATAVPNAPAIAAAGAGDRLLFASLGDGALLSAGVPSDWLDDVRAATENGFFEVAAHLPAEAAEALLQFAASGTLPASPPSVERDLYMHPDAQRRIRLVV